MVFMTYVNVVYSYGTERFVKNVGFRGMDGLILPDVPLRKEEFAAVCRCGLGFISLIGADFRGPYRKDCGLRRTVLSTAFRLESPESGAGSQTDTGKMVSLLLGTAGHSRAVGFAFNAGTGTHRLPSRQTELSSVLRL